MPYSGENVITFYSLHQAKILNCQPAQVITIHFDGKHERLNQTSWQFIKLLFRYFSTDQSGGPTDIFIPTINAKYIVV